MTAQMKTNASAKKAVNSPSHIYDTFIVGAGISGIAAAIRLDQVGYINYKIIEKAGRVGGTWRENTYPGCGCDVPSALYSYSFAPSAKWSHLFARQPEILSYLEDVSNEFNITSKIEFNNELLNAAWDESRHLWVLDTTTGQYLSRTVIFATGPITEAQIPRLEGLDTFTGEMFHSAKWNHDYDLTGKRIAVIGTGASAIQFVPQIQPKAKELFVFQRTAPWVLPKPDTDLGEVKVEGNTVIAANGERHEVDVIIWGTGFEVSHPPIGKRVFNEKGQRLNDLWKNSSPEAYLGTNIENVPNAFLVLGPNVLVYDSFIGLAEAQLDYIVDGLLKIKNKGISKLNVKADVIKKHNDLVQKHLQTTVFNSGGCKSYYLDANGRNFAAWPWSLKKLKQRLKKLDLKDYEVTYQMSKTH